MNVGCLMGMPLRPESSRISTSSMLAMEPCYCWAAMRSASFRAGSLRKVNVAVLVLAMTALGGSLQTSCKILHQVIESKEFGICLWRISKHAKTLGN